MPSLWLDLRQVPSREVCLVAMTPQTTKALPHQPWVPVGLTGLVMERDKHALQRTSMVAPARKPGTVEEVTSSDLQALLDPHLQGLHSNHCPLKTNCRPSGPQNWSRLEGRGTGLGPLYQ